MNLFVLLVSLGIELLGLGSWICCIAWFVSLHLGWKKMALGLILGLGRAFRRKRTSSLDILSSKRAPRDYYKGKNCKPTGFHTRKGLSISPAYIVILLGDLSIHWTFFCLFQHLASYLSLIVFSSFCVWFSRWCSHTSKFIHSPLSRDIIYH